MFTYGVLKFYVTKYKFRSIYYIDKIQKNERFLRKISSSIILKL